MKARSSVYRGEVAHVRAKPEKHAFTYPMTFFAFDLDELGGIEAGTGLFGYNQFRPIEIRDSDYLFGKNASISEQLETYLPKQESGEHTVLVTSPRYFGYAFNPVNFYLRMRGDSLLGAVAEVNNTFGDRHIYPLPFLERKSTDHWETECPKDFHVSPFNNMDGTYRFTFKISKNDLHIGVDLYREGNCTIQTWIKGQRFPLSNRAITRYAFLHPFSTALNTMPRILWQAAKLYFAKRMKVFKRPAPTSKNTVIDRDLKHSEARVV